MVLIDHSMDKMCTLAFCWILHWTWWVLRKDCWICCLDLHRLSAKAVLSTLFATLGLANCLVRWKLKSPCVNFPHWWYQYLWLGHVQESMFLSISFEVLCGTPKKLFKNRKGPGFVILFLSLQTMLSRFRPRFSGDWSQSLQAWKRPRMLRRFSPSAQFFWGSLRIGLAIGLAFHADDATKKTKHLSGRWQFDATWMHHGNKIIEISWKLIVLHG